MKKLLGSLVVVGLMVGGAIVLGQGQGQGQGQGRGQDPFFDVADNGETLHVLPTPAALRSPHDTGPTFAQVLGQDTTYPASYGSGDLTNHGGPQIPNASFKAIYWNASVADSTETGGHGTIIDRIDAFVTSFGSGVSDYSVITQYGAGSTPISPAMGVIPALVDQQQTRGSIKDSDIRNYLIGKFNSGMPASSSTVYGVYFPPGMKVSLQGTSCSSFCGYHGHFLYGSTRIKYAVFPYLNCSACKLSSLSVADMLTIVTSHEIREAVTDPQLNSWFDRVGYEADDKCAWHNLYAMPSGGFFVQPEYSNATHGCVVPTGGVIK